MDKTLAKGDLARWLESLDADEVYVPRCRDGVWSYELIGDAAEVTLDYPMTATPVKSIVFPSRERLLAFRDAGADGYRIEEILPQEQRVVVFGVRPCEGKALALLDKVFGGGHEDPYYLRRRRATTLVGLACATPPSDDCFCTSVGGLPDGTDGLDVLLTDLGERYHVHALSANGAALVAAGSAVMADADAADAAAVAEIHAAARARVPRQLRGIEDIPRRLEQAYDAPLWREAALGCIGCGICTFLCPTCHCFDINDEVTCAAPLAGVRVRTWDTCQFPDFTMHSSGHNPRPDTAARLRQRINHKFRYFVEAWGEYQCTGCGRCIAFCPVGIDLIAVVEQVRDHAG